MLDLPEELRVGPFTVARALELGVGRQVLRGSRFVTPFRGVRLPVELADRLDLRCRAACLVVPPDAAISHETALQLWGLPMPLGRRPSDLHVTVPLGVAVPVLAGLRGHEQLLPPSDVVDCEGLRIVRAERTVCDLATEGWPVVDLLAVADAMLSCENPGAARARLVSAVERWAGRRGVLSLRRVLELMDAPVLSAMETRVRYALLERGVPRPVVNAVVRNERGDYLHRPDLSWPRWRVAVDYDGEYHFDFGPDEAPRRRMLDLRRRERLQDEGWVLKVVTKVDLLQDQAGTVHRIVAALRDAGCPL